MSTASRALSVMGERHSGASVRAQNVTAACAIANIVKTSLGPIGLDKMLVDEIGDVTVTNDGATILKLLEVEHPAAKVLVELAQLQDEEVGDGTTSVVVMAAELLRNAEELVKYKVHPTSIISGYRLACKEACKFIQSQMSLNVDDLKNKNHDLLLNAAKTSMSSKIIGSQSDFFSKMVVDAVQAIQVGNVPGHIRYPIKAINILKCHGQSSSQSELIKGYALNCTIGSQAMPKHIPNAKIALLDFSLQKVRLPMGIHVLISDPEKLEAVRQREADITKEKVAKILAAGTNVVLVSGGIDDLCLKYMVEAGCMGIRRCKKQDLRRIAKATGGTLLSSLANIEGEETFESSYLGHATAVTQKFIGDNELVLIEGTAARTAASIVIRGANDFMCDEIERSIHDALCVVRRVLESRSVVVGGGCVEVGASIFLENLAHSIGSREQLALQEFARALLAIPKQLAVNAALDANDLVAKLRAFHNAAQQQQTAAAKTNEPAAGEAASTDAAAAASATTALMNAQRTSDDHALKAADQLRFAGLDLVGGRCRDNRLAGVFEPTQGKIKSLKFATEAAITILRIDDMIKLVPEEKPQRPGRPGMR